jgi:GntR family transcriptional regulator
MMDHTLQIDRQSPKPIFRQIEEYVLQGIESGDIKPGDRIPSQYELARMSQASRATVQKALDRLIVEEILYYQPGKGIYVTDPAVRQRLPVLQSVSHSLRVLGYEVHADLLLSEQREIGGYVGQTLGLADRSQIIHVKRLQYVNDEPVMLQDVFLEAGRFRGILERDLRQEALAEVIQDVGAVAITGSSIAIGAGSANWEESRTLNIQAGSPLLTIEEIDCDDDGAPVRFSRNKMRGDRFRAVASTLNERDLHLEYGHQTGAVTIALM